MIPAQFEYEAPGTLAEAISLLAKDPDGTKVLAGGHSLIPAMKLRLAQPQRLVDIGRIRELSYIREAGNQILIGAMTTHYQIESSEQLRKACPLLPETATHLGDLQVRNKGTIGGSLAHSDPGGDWPAPIIALSAELIAVSGKGERVIKADDFFVDLLTTALQPGEILREVRITPATGRVGQSYMKVRQPASGFAMVGIAVSLVKDSKGACQSAGVGITGVAAKAYRARGVEQGLKGSALDAKAIATAAAKVGDGVDVNSDLFASAEYRKHLADIYTRRAVELAASRAK